MVDEPLADKPNGVEEDAWLAACAAVRSYCGWHVAPLVIEEVTLDGSGGPMMFLPTLRLVDLISILNDGEAVTDPEWSPVGVVCQSTYGLWSYKFRGVVAEMEHGYETCPDDLLTVVSDLAASAARGGVSQVVSGTHQVSYEPSPDFRQRSVLDRYRLATLA